MNCPVCGDVCRCSPQPDSATLQQWTSDAADAFPSSAALPSPLDRARPEETETPTQSTARDTRIAAHASGAAVAPTADDTAWREELAARLSQYRSRRKASPPRYPSLRLPFDERMNGDSVPSSASFLDNFLTQTSAGGWAEPVPETAHVESPAPPPAPLMSAAVPSRVPAVAPPAGAKIIEFPRSAETGPPVRSDELAEPVLDRPRILDVPEVTAPPPALGGITIEGPDRHEAEKRPGIEVPLQSALLGRRLLATAIDAVIILAASALFGFVFWKLTAIRPPRFQSIGLAAGIPTLFWAVYEYLLIVYSGSTPGLRLAALEINRFDGTLTNRRLRRWRVLASYLSAASLGMGYAWAFLDEDSLCWHDRITHTYLARRNRGAQPASSPTRSQSILT